jgi:hypothetical protein
MLPASKACPAGGDEGLLRVRLAGMLPCSRGVRCLRSCLLGAAAASRTARWLRYGASPCSWVSSSILASMAGSKRSRQNFCMLSGVCSAMYLSLRRAGSGRRRL